MAERFQSISKGLDGAVAVVGSGIAGSMAALELARNGERVVLYDKKDLSRGYTGNGRSEMTVPEAIRTIGANKAITASLDQVVFFSWDNGRAFVQRLEAKPGEDPVTVAIDHNAVMAKLLQEIGNQKNIEVRDNVQVTDTQDHSYGANLTWVDGASTRGIESMESYKAIVLACGPSANGLPFHTQKLQKEWENSIVALAYGRRCRGRINLQNGQSTMLHAVSANGSGKTSWVNSTGPNEIEVIYSDYAVRKDVGKTNRRAGYRSFSDLVTRSGLVTIEEETGLISGFFSLQPLSITGNQHIYPFGERGGYFAATVGDAIAPTVRLAKPLADTITKGGSACDFEKRAKGQYNNKLEIAMTRSRMRAVELGLGFDIFNIVRWLSLENQKQFMIDHRIPAHFYPILIAKYPHLLPVLAEIGVEYLKEIIGVYKQ